MPIAPPQFGRLIPGRWTAAGARTAAVRSTGTAGQNNDLQFQARRRGLSGNAISIEFVVAGNNTPLSVDVEGDDITVNVATNGSGQATSTANQVKDAIEADAEASALISVSLVASDGPASPVAASLTTNLTGSNNDIVYTAVEPGTDGNSITVTYVVSGEDTELSVEVDGTDITVNVATDGEGLPTSTADQVKAAIEASVAASELVTVADAAANDGSGVVTALSETPLAGGLNAGSTGAGVVAAVPAGTLTGGRNYVIGRG